MLRPIEAQAVLRTVFALWKRHHVYLKSLFRNKIRANAFFKAARVRRVLFCWKESIKARKRATFKGIEIAANHRRILEDKALAGLLQHILRRRKRTSQAKTSEKVYFRWLKIRSVAMLQSNVQLALWEADANRSAVVAWREHRLAAGFHRIQTITRMIARKKEMNRRADALLRRKELDKAMGRMGKWAEAAPARDRLRLESLFAWKRTATRSALKRFLRNRSFNVKLRKLSERWETRGSFWNKKRLIHRLKDYCEARKWSQELNRQVIEFQQAIHPVHLLASGLFWLKSNVAVHLDLREKYQKAANRYKLTHLSHFARACHHSHISAVAEIEQWRRRRMKERILQQWVQNHIRFLHKEANISSASYQHQRNITAKVVNSWKVLTKQRLSSIATMGKISQRTNLKRLRVLFVHWLMKKRHKEDYLWKKTMAEEQNKLRLFRMLMSACARKLHFRRTKEYAEEMHYSHFSQRIFQKWAQFVARSLELTAILSASHRRKSQKVLISWRFLSNKTRLRERKLNEGKRIRCNWLKKTAFKAFRVFLEMNMGAITKRRHIIVRKQQLYLLWAIESWRKGIAKRRDELSKVRLMKSRRASKVASWAYCQWRLKLQQEAAKKAIKSRRVAQARCNLQKFSKKMCFRKWVFYYEKRLARLLVYRAAYLQYQKSSKSHVFFTLRQHQSRFLADRSQSATAILAYRGCLLRTAFARFSSYIDYARGEKMKHISALHLWATRRYRASLHGFAEHVAARRYKRRLQSLAAEMRKGDLVSAALQQIAKVGLEWKEERSKVAAKARLQREQRVWTVVARCAQKWKERTIRGRRVRQQERELQDKVSSLRKDRPPVNVSFPEKAPAGKARPQPRRLNSAIEEGKTVIDRSKKEDTAGDTGRPKPVRRLELSDSSERLHAIEEEVMEFRLEREKVGVYEQYVLSHPGNSSYSAQLSRMKERLNAQKPRIRELLAEIQLLRTLN